jgi:hypothetical protein
MSLNLQIQFSAIEIFTSWFLVITHDSFGAAVLYTLICESVFAISFQD